MNPKELKEMLVLMAEYGLTELEIEKNGFKIRLKKNTSGTVVVRQEEVGEPQVVRSIERAETRSNNAGTAKEDEGVIVVRSPMVGTFYVAPAPDQEPYVSKGKTVNSGDVLCIIEAMKLMNEIKSEVSGRIIDILVENGQPIEFDQPLFKIQKT